MLSKYILNGMTPIHSFFHIMLWAAAVIQEVYLVDAAESKPVMVAAPRRLMCNALGLMNGDTG